jgi:hypothetical protein
MGHEHKTNKEVREYWEAQIYINVYLKEQEEWRKVVGEKEKLRTYKTIKTRLELEPYLLSQTNKTGRYLLTALRSGTNKLRIETGRWKRPREAKGDRLCMTCMEGAVEDEKHFLLHCKAYEALREKMLQDILDASSEKSTSKMLAWIPNGKF